MQILEAKNIKQPTAIRILYGNPGMGKTSTIRFMPGKKLVIDIDGTSSVLQGADDIDIVKVDNFENIVEEFPKLLQEIKKDYLDKYDAIVIDNISELENAVLTQMGKDGKNHGVPEISHYQRVQFWELNMIRFLKSFKKNILITAWEQTDEYVSESKQSYTRSYPQIRKPILSNVMGLCLQVGRLVKSSKDGNRYVVLSPTNQVFAKNQIDAQDYVRQEDLFKPVKKEESKVNKDV